MRPCHLFSHREGVLGIGHPVAEDLEQNEHTELDLEQYNIPASDSLSMAFNAARTGPIRILSCAADSR